ncbi:MAG: UDP-N-acetylglucosamine 2-epimerase (non-hydrolyzing) [Deltaproteobacteria bacterium]|nr:UDP-N-acetylglucosamine 2-epimerase (non-hydrolyzing) [Deltaproteobacteria bacterium]
MAGEGPGRSQVFRAPRTIVTVIGARPQFVKACILSNALNQRRAVCGSGSGILKEVIIHTGQHYDYEMSRVFFDELHIPEPAYNLGISGGDHGAMTGRMMEEIEAVLLKECPDLVLLYGDTNSTLAGALAAAKLHIPVAHVEAGLRSFNRKMPEEINRVLTDHVSTLLFCPTPTAVSNLRQEGIVKGVFLVGDLMYDAFLLFRRRVEHRAHLLAELGLKPKEYLLATVHRSENTENPCRIKGIFTGLMQLARDLPVVVPLHPRTAGALVHIGLMETVSQSLRLTKPVGYLDMAALERNALLIATDSGGVQKEAYFNRVPCLTLRDETEWEELVRAGWNVLVGADPERLSKGITHLLSSTACLPTENGLYGNGESGPKILDLIYRNLEPTFGHPLEPCPVKSQGSSGS